MQRRVCDQCGTGFEARSSRAKFCSAACRVRSHRGTPKASPEVAAAVDSTPVRDLLASVRSALDAAGRTSTPKGQMCLLLAGEAMDADARALPPLTRELSARLTEALAGSAGAKGDPVDELRERRERRGVA